MNAFRFTLIAILTYFTLTQGWNMVQDFSQEVQERTNVESVLEE